MKNKVTFVADKVSIQERSLKFFIFAWVLFLIALAVRLGLSIQQYVDYQAHPLLQPTPYLQKPQNMPYIVVCYETTNYTYNSSFCNSGTLTSTIPPSVCDSSLLVATNSVTQCVLFNQLQLVQLNTTSSYMTAIVALNNITTINGNGNPTKAFITYNIMNTSDYIGNLTDTATIIPLFVDYPVFVGMQKQETVRLNGVTEVSFAATISNAPYSAPPVVQIGTLEIVVFITSFTVNQLTEINPMGIFDIMSSLGGIYSLIAGISGVLFVATIKSPAKKFVLQKDQPSEY